MFEWILARVAGVKYVELAYYERFNDAKEEAIKLEAESNYTLYTVYTLMSKGRYW